jgi:hypothetical protein
MAHKYIVELTEAEQEYLLNLIKKGKPFGAQSSTGACAVAR